MSFSRDTWTAVDRYISDLVVHGDAALDAALEASLAGGLPPISVSAPQGKFLFLLATIRGARRILEVGTLGGYSTIWLARALPRDGRLVSIEIDPHHAEIARTNLERAGVAQLVDVRVGAAVDVLREMSAARTEPFDLIFIDADKTGYPDYLQLALQLARAGTIIVADNVVREGNVIDAAHPDPRVQATRKFNEMLGADSRLEATIIQTVGSKGYDGFAIAVVSGSDPGDGLFRGPTPERSDSRL